MIENAIQPGGEDFTPSDTEVEKAFAELAAGYERAASRYGKLRTERFYTFGGRVVRVRTVGKTLANLVNRPWTHLRMGDPARDPDLRIDLFDAAETNTPCRLRSSSLHRGNVSGTADGRVLVQERECMKSGFDRQARHIVSVITRTSDLPHTEHGRPLYQLLLLWHQDRGLHTAHAGLVARDGAAALLGGPRWAGKSTTALSCRQAGVDYLSDDYVALEALPDGGFIGYGLYASAHVAPAHLERFPRLVPHAVKDGRSVEEKRVVLLGDIFPDQLTPSAPIRALVLPRVTGGAATRARPATKTEALLRLAPSSILRLPQAHLGQRGFAHLTSLVERVPAFWLELGDDLDAIPKVVSGILSGVAKS